MDMKDFKLSIYESDLSNADKEYMFAITEMAGGAAFGLVVAGALSGCIAAAAIQVRQIKTAARLYEKLYPDIPKWGSLKTEDNPIGLMSFQKTTPKKLRGKNAVATVTSDSQEKRQFVGSTEDGTKLFEITYHIDEKDTTSYKVAYESKNDIGYQHSGYYTACFCYSHNIIFPAMHKWAKTVREQVKQSKKKGKSVNESSSLSSVNSLLSTDNTINAGLMAGIAGQAGVSAFSNQERTLRNELMQLQTTLQYNAGNLTSQQQNMLLTRSGIIMEELAKAERRKGTAVAIRNAALMIAAAAKIKKMIAQDRLYGPDNPDMLRLIGGLPEIN